MNIDKIIKDILNDSNISKSFKNILKKEHSADPKADLKEIEDIVHSEMQLDEDGNLLGKYGFGKGIFQEAENMNNAIKRLMQLSKKYKEDNDEEETDWSFHFRGESMSVMATSKESAYGFMYSEYDGVSKEELDDAYERGNQCCNDDDLEWVEEGEFFPYEVWKCVKCEKMYNIEMVRDFKNKEDR